MNIFLYRICGSTAAILAVMAFSVDHGLADEPATHPVLRGPLKTVPHEFQLADGPAPVGRQLFVPDVKTQKLWVLNTNDWAAKPRLRAEAERISGTFARGGVVYAANNGRGILQRYRPGGPGETVASFGEGKKPNDLVVDWNGNAYVTFTPEGLVRKVTPDGEVSVVVEGLDSPNGIAISPIGDRLYVSSFKTGVLYRMDRGADGFGPPQRFAQMPETADGFRGDGMAVDRGGWVYCAGAESVVVFSEAGEQVASIPTDQRPINVVFAGVQSPEIVMSTFGGVVHAASRRYPVEDRVPPIYASPTEAEKLQSLEVIPDVVYHTAETENGPRRLRMDIYRQPGSQDRPAILLVHGGGWLHGDKNRFERLARRFADLGYVVANVEYRLGYEAPFPAASLDCNAALRFIKARSRRLGIDPNKIAAVGGSAGGHLVGLLAASDQVGSLQATFAADAPESKVDGSLAAVVVMAGPMEIITGSVANRSAEGKTSNATQWMGGSIDAKPQVYRLADAYEKIDGTMPPTLFVVGSEDSPERNQASREKIRAAGGVAEVVVHEGAAHGHWNRGKYQGQVVTDIHQFLMKVLD